MCCHVLPSHYTPNSPYSYLQVARAVLHSVSVRIKGARNIHHTEPASLNLKIPAFGLGSHGVESTSYFGHALTRKEVNEAALSSSNYPDEEDDAMIGISQFLIPFYGLGTLLEGDSVGELSVHFCCRTPDTFSYDHKPVQERPYIYTYIP